MYESFFHFHQRPFVSAPNAAHYFPSEAIEHARQSLIRCVERSQGPGLLIGPSGTGKSLLCQIIAEHFRNSFSVALLANTQLCTRKALLQSILFELNLPYRDLEEGELRLSLIDHLEPGAGSQNGLLLIMDEAHTLPLRLLEEVRMITNIVRHGMPRVRLILAGGPQLEERFASPKLESFNQRVAARCYLQPLNREETYRYVRSQIAVVGGEPDQIFSEASLRAVFQATDGVPRLINQVCDYALLLASVSGRQTVDASAIEEAWADLQQIPAPWQTASNPAAVANDVRPATSNVVEFGELDDTPVAGDQEYADQDFSVPVSHIEEPNSHESVSPVNAQTETAHEEQFDAVIPEPEFQPIAHAPHSRTTPLYGSALESDPETQITNIERNLAEAYATEFVSCELDDLVYSPEALPLTNPDPIVEFSSRTSAASSATTSTAKTDATLVTPQQVVPNHIASSNVSKLKNQKSTVPQDPFGDDFDDEEIVIDRYIAVEDEVLQSRPRVASVEGRVLAAAFRAQEDSPIRTSDSSLRPAAPAISARPMDVAPNISLFEEASVPSIASPPIPTPVATNFDAASDPVLPEIEDVVQPSLESHSETCSPQPIAVDSFSQSFVAVAAPAAGFNWDSAAEEISHSPQIDSGNSESSAPRMRVVPPDDRDLLIFDEEIQATRTKPSTPHDGRAKRQEYRHLFAKLRRG